PQWTGGGVVHGPVPRSYAQRTPKKMIAAAIRGALSDRARNGRVHVVDAIVAGETPSTKSALQALTGIASNKILVVLHRDEDVAWLSLRNVAVVHAIAVDQLNAYDVLLNDDVVFTSAALQVYVGTPVAGVDDVILDEVEVEASEAVEASAPVKGSKNTYRGAEPPAGFEIKGNEDSMLFHTPESPWYAATIAEVWFKTEKAAEKAGFVNAVKKGEDSK
ncbi:MAG: 50S ribosomal protein L4, partial [Micropruina sp.]